MLYNVKYEETIVYDEVYEARSKEEAYRMFYQDLEEDDLEPDEIQFHDLTIDPFIDEMPHKPVRKIV